MTNLRGGGWVLGGRRESWPLKEAGGMAAKQVISRGLRVRAAATALPTQPSTPPPPGLQVQDIVLRAVLRAQHRAGAVRGAQWHLRARQALRRSNEAPLSRRCHAQRCRSVKNRCLYGWQLGHFVGPAPVLTIALCGSAGPTQGPTTAAPSALSAAAWMAA